MLPSSNDLFWKWKLIYEELVDPFTKTVTDSYFFPILETQLKYCNKINIPLSIAILDIQNLPSLTNSNLTLDIYLLTKDITSKIRKKLSPFDMIFYNGNQTFLFLFPKADKENIQKLLDSILDEIENIYSNKNPLIIKGGYAEFPTDAKDGKELEECAKKALSIANQLNKNRIIGYFTERRRNYRAPLVVETRYTAPGSLERLTCSRNISETGIMISGMPDLKLGEGIKLVFNIPNTINYKIMTFAKTIWNKIIFNTDKINIGLCFTDINNEAKEQIKKYIANHPSTNVNA